MFSGQQNALPSLLILAVRGRVPLVDHAREIERHVAALGARLGGPNRMLRSHRGSTLCKRLRRGREERLVRWQSEAAFLPATEWGAAGHRLALPEVRLDLEETCVTL